MISKLLKTSVLSTIQQGKYEEANSNKNSKEIQEIGKREGIDIPTVFSSLQRSPSNLSSLSQLSPRNQHLDKSSKNITPDSPKSSFTSHSSHTSSYTSLQSSPKTKSSKRLTPASPQSNSRANKETFNESFEVSETESFMSQGHSNKSESEPPLTVTVNLNNSGLSVHRSERRQAQVDHLLSSNHTHQNLSFPKYDTEEKFQENLLEMNVQDITPEIYKRFEDNLLKKYKQLTQLVMEIDMLKSNAPQLEPREQDLKFIRTLKIQHSGMNSQFENNIWFLREMKELCLSWKLELVDLQNILNNLELNQSELSNATDISFENEIHSSQRDAQRLKNTSRMYKVSSVSKIDTSSLNTSTEKSKPNLFKSFSQKEINRRSNNEKDGLFQHSFNLLNNNLTESQKSQKPPLKKSFTTKDIINSNKNQENNIVSTIKNQPYLKRGSSDTFLLSNSNSKTIDSSNFEADSLTNLNSSFQDKVSFHSNNSPLAQEDEDLPWDLTQHEKRLENIRKLLPLSKVNNISSSNQIPKDKQLQQIIKKRLKKQKKLKNVLSSDPLKDLTPFSKEKNHNTINDLERVLEDEQRIAEESKDRFEKIRSIRLGSIQVLTDDALKQRLTESLYSLNHVEDKLAVLATKIVSYKNEN